MSARSRLLVPVAALLALAPLVGCSDDAPEPTTSNRLTIAELEKDPCLAVPAKKVSSILGHEVTADSTNSQPCRYSAVNPEASSAVVEVRPRAGADDPTRLLPTGTPVDGVGSQAVFAPGSGPLDARLIAREAGTMVVVDMGPLTAELEKTQQQAAAIARAALARAPKTKVVKGETEAGDGPCEALGDGKALAKTFDAPVTVTPGYPSGCVVSVTGRGNATVLGAPLPGGKPSAVTDIERATNDKPWPKTEIEDLGDAAVWLDDPIAPGAGQLSVADGDQLITVATDPAAGTPAQAQDLAVAVAAAALS